jgi:lysozyme
MARSKTTRRAGIAGGVIALAIGVVGAWEGLKLATYRDIVGVPTVCYGETRGVKMGDRYTKEECDAMLGEGLSEFEEGIDKCLRAPGTIPVYSKVAFLSLSYNIGIRGFCGSSIAARWNAGNLAGACEAILLWNKAGGKVIKGLVNRRADEREWCIKGLKQ